MRWRLAGAGQDPGEARLIESDGERAVVDATRAFPIGATLRALDPETNAEYSIKIRGGRRLDERWFRLEGRFVSLSRAERERLLAALASESEP